MSAFSTVNPNLQIAWDSTSLQSIQFCPRYYQYSHLEGWQGDSVDLEFGRLAASAWELFQKSRLQGKTRDEAMLAALRYTMEASEGFGGHYETQWHCTGETKYKNAKGNAAKCPYCHKGAFFPEPAPSICGECGSGIEVVRNYIPVSPAKNRHTLVRMVVWYCMDQPEVLEDGLYPYTFPNGQMAVELSFQIPLELLHEWRAAADTEPVVEPYTLCGHIDYIGVFGEELFVVDNKTTTKYLGNEFFDAYSPHFQFDTYDLVATVLFPSLPVRGVLLDGAQTMAGGARFGRHPYYKSEAMREEHLEDIHFWIKLAEQYATEGRWPMNKRNCWLCAFKKICSLDPASRETFLKANFNKRERWDPTVAR